MTVAVNDTIERYTITGVGPYAYTWRIFNDTDLVVVALSTASPPVVVPLTYLTHYTVSGANASAGGTITLTAAAYPTYSGYTLDIRSATPRYQPTSIRNQARFLPEIHEDAFDCLDRQIQDLGRLVDASVRSPDNEPALAMVLPALASRIGKYQAFDLNGQPIASVGTGNDTALRTDLASTVVSNDGSRLVGFRRTEAGAVARAVADVLRERLSVADFGTIDPTGVADSTAAFVAALAAATPGVCVTFPKGTFKITAKLTVGERVHFKGVGKWASILNFVPTGANTLIEMKNAATVCDQSSVSDMTLYSTESTFTKVALDCIDLNSCTIERVTIAGSTVVGSTSYWSGANSIGLRVRGRQANGFRDLDIQADRPIVIATNPNNSISIDHTNFHNLYLTANGNPDVEILTGVNLTQVSFSGYQAWVLGTSGLKWNDTTSAVVSNGLTLENVRCEQGTDPTAYSVDISHNTGLQNLTLFNCYGGVDRRGAKLRKVQDIKFIGHYHAGATIALDVDATVKRITGLGCFWQASATAVLVGQRLVRGAPLNPNSAPLRPDFYYDELANADQGIRFNAGIGQDPVTIANNGIATLGTTTMRGLLMISTSGNENAIYSINGTNNTTIEVSDPLGVYTTVAGTAASLNIYWNGGTSRYEIENKRGASRDVTVTLLGTYN